MIKQLSILGAFVIAGAAAWIPQEADACGGTFCDQPPPGDPAMPVDQTGENILFVVADGFVEAHVQIQYEGEDAARFAWLVPVPAVPQLEVGSFRLVDNLLATTVPVYGFQNTNTCPSPDDDDDDSQTSGFGFIENPDGGGGSTGEPDVVIADTVGAFDFVVLEGGTSEGIATWLEENDFAQDADAPDILDEYLDEGFLFIAFRLSTADDVEDIHPVVIRYPGTEPCIPLRLTRIAAVDDMDIRAFVLGEARAFPVAYDHVEINDVRLDWPNLAPNYRDVVTMAVDEAGGRAFVTEYAGGSDVVSRVGLDASDLDEAVFIDAEAVDVIDLLHAQGVMSCDRDCFYNHDLIRGLLLQHLPVPDGVEEQDFYTCLTCWRGLIDEDAWNGIAFAADYRERIIDPMVHANDLLDTWPYLTRLYTTISPHEMLSDPTFAEVPGLSDVANRRGSERRAGCCETTMRLPDGRDVIESGAWPNFPDMPFAEEISEYQPDGPPSVLIDNAETIDTMLAEYNAAVSCEGGGTGGGGDGGADGGGEGGATSGGGGGGTSGAGTGGQGGDGPDPSGGGGVDDSEGSCSCRSDGGGPAVGALLLLGLLGLRRRR